MGFLSYSQAFRTFGAKLRNPLWAYSAVADDGAVVISCWNHKLKLLDGVLTYTDRISRWDANAPGKKLLIDHLTRAQNQALPIRLVIATTDQPDVVDRGEEARGLYKTFHTKQDVVGSVASFNGDQFVLEFRRPQPANSVPTTPA